MSRFDLQCGLQSWAFTAMPLPFAPEPDPVTNVLQLREHQTSGPQPVGFEFELFGSRYTWFDVSWDGFLTFGNAPLPCLSVCDDRSLFLPLREELNNFVALGWNDHWPGGPRQVAYMVREAAQRRRLVLSVTAAQPYSGPARPQMSSQLVFYERTGMIDAHGMRHDPVTDRMCCGAARFTQTCLDREYGQLDSDELTRITRVMTPLVQLPPVPWCEHVEVPFLADPGRRYRSTR
jgi:hypothetical protein